MANSAINFNFPPPIKPKEIRLVLPDDDESPEGLSEYRNGAISDEDSSPEFATRGFGESLELASRSAELNEIELALNEREETLKQAEARLIERERGLWEYEALILAREKLLNSQQKQSQTHRSSSPEVCKEELQALEQLRAEVARQQESLEQTKEELKEREEFVETSESRLLEKTMQQQEEESRLEQMKEDLIARELRVNQLEGKPPPPEVPKEVL